MENLNMCLPLAVHQFPDDLFSQTERREGAVVLHLVGAFYAFGCLAYLCDTYFVPALEVLSDKLNLRADIAGATFMAIGSSSPELFTSLIGVFVARDDVGLGAIVGSAVFNIMFVIGCCIFVTPGALSLEVWPVVRDASYYCLALIPVAVITNDQLVDWYEGVILVLMYVVYISLMYFNRHLESLFYKLLPSLKEQDRSNIFSSGSHWVYAKTPELHVEDKGEHESFHVETNDNQDTRYLMEQAANEGSQLWSDQHSAKKDYLTVESGDHHVSNHSQDIHGHEVSYRGETSSFLNELTPPKSCFKCLLWCVGLPVVLLFAITLPNPTNPRTSFLFPVTFLLSLLYIGALSYALVWMVTLIGYTVGIPDIIMGLVFLAAGASVPDALASIIVAKDGYGKMSVSNCIGSNVFDILLGLGLPWTLKTLVTDYKSQVKIHSSTIHFTIFILMGNVLALLVVFSISKWRLRRSSGVALILLYVAFITVSCLFEMNVFGDNNPSSCSE